MVDEGLIDQQNLNEGVKQKKRNPWIAFLFSLFIPGMGHYYNGKWKLGIFYYLVPYFVLLLFGYTRWVTHFNGLIVFVILLLVYRIFLIANAVAMARRQFDYDLKPFNTWYYNLIIILGILAIEITIVDAKSMLGVESFRIPVPGGKPVIQPGDAVFFDIWYYETHKPQYGDIALFDYNNEKWTYRIVGLPGDVLSFDEHRIIHNSKRLKTVLCDSLIEEVSPQFKMVFYRFKEYLPNGLAHFILIPKMNLGDVGANFGNYIVPEGHVMVIGNNRANALDSRYIGAIPMEKLCGRMAYIWWGSTYSRINAPLYQANKK